MVIRITAILILISLIAFPLSYYNILNGKKSQAKEDAKRIDSSFVDSFDYAEKVIAFMAEDISRHDKKDDLKFINDLFLKVASTQRLSNNVFSWNMFDWVNREGYQVVNTMGGINTESPTNMTFRKYFWKAKYSPNSRLLQFSDPAFGVPSGVYIIPVGVGVSDKKGSYLGLIAAGINIKKLTNNAMSQLKNSNSFIVVLNDTCGIAFDSSGLPIGPEKYASLPGKIKDVTMGSEGFMSKSVNAGEDVYIYYRSMDNKYPYLILTGYNKKDFWHEVIARYITIMSQVVIIMIAVMATPKLRNSTREK